MTISAKIITDSVGDNRPGVRLTTFELRYPRFIHAELMTHRVFSRNASSSRAMPVQRLIQDVMRDPAIPMHWGKNQKGMQADEELNCFVNLGLLPGDYDITSREEAWLIARNHAVIVAEQMSKAGYHKQIVNRLIEPFSHITTVVTATEFSNWFAQRLHPDAQPEMQELSNQMYCGLRNNTPQVLLPGEWHLPYITDEDVVDVMKDMMEHDDNWGVVADEDLKVRLTQISAARCARTSYLNHEGKRPSIQEDLVLYSRLMDAQPIHPSPTEHQGTPDVWVQSRGQNRWKHPELHGNFFGWVQFRKTIEGEGGGTRTVRL